MSTYLKPAEVLRAVARRDWTAALATASRRDHRADGRGDDVTVVDSSLWPNAYVPAVCECGHGRGMHNLSPSSGRRTGCSVSSGPKATPCGCKTYAEASPVSLPEEERA